MLVLGDIVKKASTRKAFACVVGTGQGVVDLVDLRAPIDVYSWPDAALLRICAGRSDLIEELRVAKNDQARIDAVRAHADLLLALAAVFAS